MERIFHFDHVFVRALLASMMVLAATQAANASAKEPAHKGPAIDVSPCSPLLEQILPGDYNFCRGAVAMRKGDQAEVVSRMRAAAAWGDKSAQKVLGLVYFNGEGVTQNRPLGLAWLALSTERKEPENLGLFNSAYAKATPEQKTQANVLYRQMLPKYADDVAAVRADKLFRRKMRELASNPVYGSGKCIRGVNSWGFANPKDPQSIQACSLISEQRVLNGLQARYDVYFEDWSGRVKTGDVEDVSPGK